MRDAPVPAASQRPWKRALLWLAFLGPFFFASYGFANWVASRRTGVGSVVFGWEQHIPFLAWTIVPYWSIDLLYALSLFVCTTRRELDVHGLRLLCAQVLCVVCFLAFPLRYAFSRPDTDGYFELMFDALMGFDKPFNQMPSLHIALLVILWVRYLHHTRGLLRWAVHLWATLVMVSVLTAYQHHFIDIPTGLWVGWLSIWLFPEDGRALLFSASMATDGKRRTLAVCYGAASLVLGTIAVFAGGWALWLLWIAGSLVLVAMIYAFLDETAFQKGSAGSMSVAAWWLLAPYFATAWLNSRWWTRAMPGAHAIVPGLMLGRLPSARERNALRVRGVIDMTAELPCAVGCTYVNVPQLDLTAPSVTQIDRAVAAIDAAFAQGPVLVCCALGFSRSATVVAAWLVASGRATDHADAIALIRRARPAVVFAPAHLAALERYTQYRKDAA